jgi:DNA-binding transcriptional LysR family regulator
MALPEPLPDLAALSLLVTVGQVGSITAAARVHNITQPAASMRLRSLERVLGVQLLSRDRSGSRLTPAGVATVEWASTVLHDVSALLAATDALRRDQRSHLEVAASLTVAEYLLPQWLLQLAIDLPDTSVSLEMGNTVRVIELVAESTADLGFVEGPQPPVGFHWRDLRKDELVFVVGKNHPWARRRRPVTASQVARTPLILREHGSGTRDVLAGALVEHGLDIVASMELASTTAIKAAAMAGAGPAVLSALAVESEIRSGQLVRITSEGLQLHRTIRAIWKRGRPLAGPGARLLAIAAGSR